MDSQITLRENVEWLNFWRSDAANVEDKTRYLLIGDSTARAYRATLENMMKVNVDFFGTSSRITDTMFWKELECFFSFLEYSYDMIQIQLGYHGIHGENGEMIESEWDNWKRAYKQLIDYLQGKCDKIIVTSTTHTVINPSRKKLWDLKYFYYKLMHKWGNKVEKDNIEKNRVIKRKNEIAELIAMENNLLFIDLWDIMKNSKFRHIDEVHFEEAHKEFISAEIIKKIQDNFL